MYLVLSVKRLMFFLHNLGSEMVNKYKSFDKI